MCFRSDDENGTNVTDFDNAVYFTGDVAIAAAVDDTRDDEVRLIPYRILHGRYLPTVILIIIGIPSTTHSFIPGLKPFFSANPSYRSLSFSSSGLTTWIPQTVYCYF